MNEKPAMPDVALLRSLSREIQDVAATTQGALVDATLLDALEVRRIDLSCAQADAIRVVLFGEFKTGKSTLVNALIGRPVSGVDFLEKTSAVVRFFRSDELITAVHLSNGTVAVDRPHHCDDKTIDELVATHKRENIRRIDVGLPTEINYVLVDTPGIGGRQSLNQIKAMEGVREADVILLCIAADSIGGSRDTGTAKDLVRDRMPTILVLTRVDLLDTETEVEEARSWISTHVGAPRDRVLPIGGLNAGRAAAGLDDLRHAISELTKDGVGTRRAAELAQSARVEAALRAIIRQCIERLDSWCKVVDDAMDTIESVALAVEQNVRRSLLDDVERRLFSPDAVRVITSVAGSIENVPDAFALKSLAQNEWNTIAGGLSDIVIGEWRGRLGGLTEKIESLCRSARTGASEFLASKFDKASLVQRISDEERNVARAGVNAAAAAAAGGVGLSLIGGTALGAAVTGVGLPIAAVGAVLSLVVGRYAARRERARVAEEIRNHIETMKDEFRAEVLEAQVFPALRAMNRNVVKQLHDEALARVSPFATQGDLVKCRDRFKSMQARIDIL